MLHKNDDQSLAVSGTQALFQIDPPPKVRTISPFSVCPLYLVFTLGFLNKGPARCGSLSQSTIIFTGGLAMIDT